MPPVGQREAVALGDRGRRVVRRRGRPERQRQPVLVAAIDQHRHLATVDDVETAAHQREPHGREIVHRRRVVDPAGEPWLHRVTIGRGDVDRMRAERDPEIARDQLIGLAAALLREHAAQPADAERHDDARRHRRPAHALARPAGNGAQLPFDSRAQKIGRGFSRHVAQQPAHRPRRLEPPPALRAGFEAALEVGALARRQLAVDIGVDHRLTCRAVHGLSFPGGRAIGPPVSRAPVPGAT